MAYVQPTGGVTAFRAGAKPTEISSALVTNVGQAASGIVSSMLLVATGASLDSLKPQIKGYLGENVALALTLHQQGMENVPLTIEDKLKVDYDFMVDAIKAGLGQGVGSLHSSLYGMLAGTDALIGGYLGLIQQVGINPIISRWINSKVKPNIPDAETSWLLHRLGYISDEYYTELGNQNGWPTDAMDILDRVWTAPIPISILLDLYRRQRVTLDELKYHLRLNRFDDAGIDQMIGLSVQYPEPYRLAEMHTKALVTSDEYLATTRIFGLPDNWAMNWSDGQIRYPDFSTALALLRRGVIDNNTFYFWMQRSQIQPEETEALLNLKDVIPPIDDLIRFAVREAYGEHDPEKQYSAMVNIAKKMGLTEEASAWYWYAHWTRIPINLMFANYHRGLWDKPKLEHLLKIADIHPDDRQDIINVAYQPPSIREMGYGYDVGVYTIDDIKRYRRWGGLSPEDAEKAGTAMVAYRTEAERNSVRTEYMYAYGRASITREQLEGYLLDIGTAPEAIPLWLERADLYKERITKEPTMAEQKIVSSSEAISAFKLGLRDEAWARDRLKDLGWVQERIDVAVEKAKKELAEVVKPPVEVAPRAFTIAQLTSMYKLQIITKETFAAELEIIGYSEIDAALLVEIYTQPEVVAVKPKVFTTTTATRMYDLCIYDEDDLYENFIEQDWDSGQAAMLTMYTLISLEYPKLRTMYSKGAISGEEMVKALAKLEMSEYNARLLVQKTYDELQLERLVHEKDLTKAEIIKGAKNNVLTINQAAELLQGIGYDENEAYYILAINKVVAAGDPESYFEMKQVVEAYKKARGLKSMEITPEMLELEKQIKATRTELDKERKLGANEIKIGELAVKLGGLESHLRTLLARQAGK